MGQRWRAPVPLARQALDRFLSVFFLTPGSALSRLSVLRFELDERVESLGLVSVNPVGAIMYCNATFEAMLGFEPGGRAQAGTFVLGGGCGWVGGWGGGGRAQAGRTHLGVFPAQHPVTPPLHPASPPDSAPPLLARFP